MSEFLRTNNFYFLYENAFYQGSPYFIERMQTEREFLNEQKEAIPVEVFEDLERMYAYNLDPERIPDEVKFPEIQTRITLENWETFKDLFLFFKLSRYTTRDYAQGMTRTEILNRVLNEIPETNRTPYKELGARLKALIQTEIQKEQQPIIENSERLSEAVRFELLFALLNDSTILDSLTANRQGELVSMIIQGNKDNTRKWQPIHPKGKINAKARKTVERILLDFTH